MNSKIVIPVIAVASLVALLVFSPQVLSQNFSFDFASDISPTQTSILKVTGMDSMSIEPDAVIIGLDLYSLPTDSFSNVVSYQQSLVDELTAALEELSESDDDFKVTRSDDSRIYIDQTRTADPSQSSYTVDFRFPVKVQHEKFDQLFSDLTSDGFIIDDINLIQAPLGELTPTSTVNAAIPEGTSVPGCEENFSCFDPYELVVTSGTSVIWTNLDAAAHTVTSGMPEGGPDGFFDSALFVSNGEFSHTFYQPGEYNYFCMVHPWMVGKIIVSSEGEMVEPPETNLFVEFDVFVRSSPDTIQSTLDFYQEKVDDLVVILENHEINTDEIPQRPVRVDDRFRGYGEPLQFEGREQIAVKTKLENVEKVIEIAASKNVRINDIYPTYSDSALDEIRPQLTQMALDDAKKNVLELIGGDGLEIKAIKSIEINTSSMIDTRYDGQVHRGLVLNADRSYQNLDPIYTKVEVEFEIGH